MGFFAEIASEARREMVQTPPPAKRTAAPPPPAAPEVKPTPPAAPEPPAEQPVSTPADPPAAPAPAPVVAEAPPAPEQPGPAQPPEPPALDLTAKADAADEAERRKAHEAAEAKRKAEWDARQAEKKAVRQKQIDKIAAMNSAELLEAAVGRVAADTEKLTRRNMKEAVAEHIQAKCQEDAAFAMLVMDPGKSMVNCFQYINRQARKYAEQEMKDQGIERTGTYGCDVPDGLCYQWAEDYFKDKNAEEDHKDDEKFVPKPYIPKSGGSKAKTVKKKPEKKPAAEKSKSTVGIPEQISLM